MKTDLKKLNADLEAAIATLTADANELAAAEKPTAETLRQQSLLGHAISGLRGVSASLKGISAGKPGAAS